MSFGDTLIEEDGFGYAPKLRDVPCWKPYEIIKRYTMINKQKAIVRLISWGAGIQSIRIPDRNGTMADVVLGFDDIDGYLKNRHMGSIIGRVSGDVSGNLDNAICSSLINTFFDNYLNFNTNVFNNVNWQSQIVDNRVVMSHLSQTDSGGYLGDVLTQVNYTWTDDSQLLINIRATTTIPTHINVTNYCLFNLAGHGTGAKELEKHVLTVNADSWTVMALRKLPTGIISPVDCTVFELRVPAQLNRRRLYSVPGGGYDHNLCINGPSAWSYRFHARILHPPSGRFLEVYSNHPGLQVYTGNQLPDPERVYPPDLQNCDWGGEEPINSLKLKYVSKTKKVQKAETKEEKKEIFGKGGIAYRYHGAFALSPQNYPGAVDIKHFPSCVLSPGKIYVHDMSYKFGVKAAEK
ncbi:hypothetical protein HN011_005297 [Eciton burchellii]|nr:hypothetical protein HN011_005297 [Eciton burchellii]